MARREHGINLIEVMVTLTVFGILVALGAPGFVEWLQSQRLRAAAEAITNGLQVARGEAIRRNLPVTVGLEPPGSGWTVCEATITPCDSTTVAPNFIQNKEAQEASGSASIEATPAGAFLVTFSPLGSVIDNLDGTPRLSRIDVRYPPTTCSADGGNMRCLRVVVTPGGTIRMCDPTPAVVAPDPRACP